MRSRELILYLSPEGPLAEQCAAYLDASRRRFGANAAHDYPPHVTLTGFFRRKGDRASAAICEMNAAIDMQGAVPADAVRVVGLHRTESWLGLEIEAPWAKALTETVVASHEVQDHEDPLRPKDWLHLSLAYGLGPRQDLQDSARLANELVDCRADVSWHAGIWERYADGTFRRR